MTSPAGHNAKPEVEDLTIPAGQIYATAEQLAHRFNVGVNWVKRRKSRLGATPISDSANSKLRYHVPTADAYMRSRMLEPAEIKVRRSSTRGKRTGDGRIQFV